jgi:hypothetical protein
MRVLDVSEREHRQQRMRADGKKGRWRRRIELIPADGSSFPRRAE